MPGRDRTGPMGEGPMTGGGFGLCGRAGAGRGGWPGRRMGYGAGWGRAAGGRGFGRRFDFEFMGRGGRPYGWGGPYAADVDEEKDFLKAQAEDLKAELTRLEKRLADLERAEATETET